MEDSLSILSRNFNKSGMSVDIKKRMPDGSYMTATEAEIQSVEAQGRLASVASAIQDLPQEDKTKWAINMKDFGNSLYEKESYKEAMEYYLQV